MTQTLFLVRHAHTRWNAEGRYLGSTDVDLDELGAAQAAHLARWAASVGITDVVTSPARRAAVTAQAVVDAAGLHMREDARLAELGFGAAEGSTLAELRLRMPEVVERFEEDPDAHHFPGGEAPAQAVQRMARAAGNALRDGGPRILIVTHNTILRLYVCHVLGIPLARYRRCLPIYYHCAYTELQVIDGRFALISLNAPAVDTRRCAELPHACDG